MRPHEPYKPQKRKNPMLIIASAAFAAAVIVLWIFKKQLMIETADMCILTGVSLLSVLLTICDVRRRNDIYLTAMELKKQRDEMDCDDFSDNSIFFRD